MRWDCLLDETPPGIETRWNTSNSNGNTSTQNTSSPNGSKIPYRFCIWFAAGEVFLDVVLVEIDECLLSGDLMGKVLHIADEVIIRVGSGSNFRLVWNIPIFDRDIGNGAVGRQIICIGNNKIDNLSIIGNEYKQLIQRLADTARKRTSLYRAATIPENSSQKSRRSSQKRSSLTMIYDIHKDRSAASQLDRHQVSERISSLPVSSNRIERR